MQKSAVIFFVMLLTIIGVHAQFVPPVGICPGGGTSFAAGIGGSGYTYQWQVNRNDNNGFVNLTADANHTGVTTGTLTINNAQVIMSGYSYHCLCTNTGVITISKTYMLDFTVVWTGAVDAAWENAGNWNCGVLPGPNTDVFVNRDLPRYPFVNTNTNIRSLTVDSFASVTTKTGINLVISGSKPSARLNGNVHVIDSIQYIILSDSAMQSEGVYKFSSLTGFPDFKINDIITGPTGEGYIRKINSVTRVGSEITLQTVAGTLEDVFDRASFDFDLFTSDLSERNITETALNYQFSNVVLYSNGPNTITLTNGAVSLDPKWQFGFSYRNSENDFFKMSSIGSSLNANARLNVSLTQSVVLPETEKLLKTFKKSTIVWVPTIWFVRVPVVVSMTLNLLCRYSANASASMQRDILFDSHNNFDLGIQYTNAQWQPIYNIESSNNVSFTGTTANINSTVNLAIVPEMRFKIAGVLGPYASLAFKEKAKAGIVLPAADWDFSLEGWLNPKIGAQLGAIGYSVNYDKEWNTDTITYRTPDTLKMVSGDAQEGNANQVLNLPLKVRVVDSKGESQSGVPVYFAVTAGTGTLLNASAATNSSGFAQVNWKLGPETTPQEVTVTAKKSNGSFIYNAPIKFSAMVDVDTAALLISHGTWKAFEGFDEDGDILNDTAFFTNFFPNCNTTEYHYGCKDSLHLDFNANGTGTYKVWEHNWGTDGTNFPDCDLIPYDSLEYNVAPFTWEFISELKVIRMIYPNGVWGIPPGEPVDFSISSFSPFEMHLAADLLPDETGLWAFKFN